MFIHVWMLLEKKGGARFSHFKCNKFIQYYLKREIFLRHEINVIIKLRTESTILIIGFIRNCLRFQIHSIFENI